MCTSCFSCFLRGSFVCVCVCSVISNSFDTRSCNLPDSSVHGVPQARILEWVAISYATGSSQPDPAIEHASLGSPTLAGGFITQKGPTQSFSLLSDWIDLAYHGAKNKTTVAKIFENQMWIFPI